MPPAQVLFVRSPIPLGSIQSCLPSSKEQTNCPLVMKGDLLEHFPFTSKIFPIFHHEHLRFGDFHGISHEFPAISPWLRGKCLLSPHQGAEQQRAAHRPAAEDAKGRSASHGT